MPEQTLILDNSEELSKLLNKKRDFRFTAAIPPDVEKQIVNFAVRNHFNFNQALNVILATWAINEGSPR